jgi:hypothetical protein
VGELLGVSAEYSGICILRGLTSIDRHAVLNYISKAIYSSRMAMSTTNISQPTAMDPNEAGPSKTPANHGKRPVTARACDACRTRKLKCSGRPDTVDVNDAGVAVIPCEVRSWLK